MLHPWHLVDLTRQTSQEVEHRLQGEVIALETLTRPHGLAAKKTTLDKVHKQLAGIAALVDFWWQTVEGDLAEPCTIDCDMVDTFERYKHDFT